MKSNEEWTEIVTPKRSLFDLNLKELWRYRDLILLFVRRDFVSVYKQTILGPLWLFIQPLFTTLIFFVVFTGLYYILKWINLAIAFYWTHRAIPQNT